jgi:hypothetical protein
MLKLTVVVCRTWLSVCERAVRTFGNFFGVSGDGIDLVAIASEEVSEVLDLVEEVVQVLLVSNG